ncbi:MAG TPA: tripartite tricarboxylate transporter substrate binding protein [Burkholderiales bacterium]|nr:tripartite tricarboxylate transporter substrate binding protein [Burkholderiales bacterium]
MRPRARLLLPAAIACWLSAPVPAARTAGPDTYPQRPVRMVIAFAPGGGTDIIGRIVAQRLSEAWGQTVVVDNRPGAGSTIGTEIVARAAPDGHTLQTVSMSHALNVSLYRKLPYDPVRDFAPVAQLATAPNVLVVHPSVPARSVKELIALAKSRPGQLNFSSSGSGGVSHLSAELLRSAAGIDIVHVPYKGAGPAMTALLAGEVQIMMATMPVASAQIKANRVRALAISSAKRSPLAPELPTIAEAGFPGFQTDTWYGVLAPSRTPPALVHRINRDIARVLEAPEVKAMFEQQGAQTAAGTPESFGAFIRAEIEKWAKVIRAARIEPL